VTSLNRPERNATDLASEMDQSELANPTIVVVTPNLPHFVVGGSGDSNDLAALARLVMFVPHRGRPEELQFGEGT